MKKNKEREASIIKKEQQKGLKNQLNKLNEAVSSTSDNFVATCRSSEITKTGVFYNLSSQGILKVIIIVEDSVILS